MAPFTCFQPFDKDLEKKMSKYETCLTDIRHWPMKTSFHALLTFIYFVTFLFFGLCFLLILVSLDTRITVLFILDLHMKYTVEMVSLGTYIVWFVVVR